MKLHGASLKPGDVLMTNSPHAGGSHLPDITLITPVFHPSSDKNEIIFFTASRGHHADIGGILPGSMPPTSTSIFDEGAEVVSFKIVDGGVFDQDGLYVRLCDEPARHPGSSGCRNIRDVESDLKAVRVCRCRRARARTHRRPVANRREPQGRAAHPLQCASLPPLLLAFLSPASRAPCRRTNLLPSADAMWGRAAVHADNARARSVRASRNTHLSVAVA
jgi:hypothetical protein